MTKADDTAAAVDEGRALLRTMERWAAIIIVAMALGSLVFGIGPVLQGVLAGGAIGWLNLELLVRLLNRVTRRGGGEGEGAAALLLLLLPLKLLALAGLAYLLVIVVGVDAIGFLAGVAGALLALVIAHRRVGSRPAERTEKG